MDRRSTVRDGRGVGIGRLGAGLTLAWRAYVRLVRTLVRGVFGLAFLALAILFLNDFVLATDQARAYRDLDPGVPDCRAGLETGWTVLADIGREALRTAMTPDDEGWRDASNDERAVTARDPRWNTRFRCALQRHVVPSAEPQGRALAYHLGFIEFQEDGEPYALVSREAGGDTAIDSAMLRNAMEGEIHARKTPADAVRPVITQLDALQKHLSTGSHYVIAFVHGWRHDARIGDGNVADLRLYAGHAARFLAQRCPTDPAACTLDVTAIYVGWRGARVDERGLRETFGDAIGGFFGALSAGATLFDRKPVSEAIAPAAISALRSIESTLAGNPANRLIVAGHSLGGNVLATGLKDDLLKAVRRHRSGEDLAPVLGNLVVLINPASEASKWTAIQREVWSRVADPGGPRTDGAAIGDDDFPQGQRPVMLSVTAALAFPAGGLRPGDCAWIGLDFPDAFTEARRTIRRRLAATDGMFRAGADYDWATHDLFPTFKLDFRPAAAFLDRAAARFEGRMPRGMTCAAPAPAGLWNRILTAPVRALSLVAATFPFQNTAREESHTIGNLDPPRPAAGVLADAQASAAPFGTTHELMGLDDGAQERHHPYATLADAAIDCPRSDQWLTRARRRRAAQGGLFWDSADLAPADPARPAGAGPAARFLHGLQLTGIAPITRANDPFWNVRAFDNALARHDGYRLSAFICALNQLVMDDITDAPNRMQDRMGAPDRPKP